MEISTVKRKKYLFVFDKNRDISPNCPVHFSKDEWVNYFSEIEKGNFTNLEISNQNFSKWKEENH